MVNGKDQIYVESKGKLTLTDHRFTSDKNLLGAIERILMPIGRRVDEKTPLVDARLKDGSRVNIIISPLSLKGPIITIRKFFKEKLTIQDLVKYNSLTEDMGDFLRAAVEARLNIVVSGGTGTGKTTLIEAVIKELKSRNLKVGAIKHDAHKFDIDYPGKDSYRFTAAGADTMLISSTEKMAMVAKPAIELDMESVLAKFFGDMDIVLTEGYKRSSLPKIVVIRENFPADLDLFKQCLSGQIVAFVSDRALNEKQPILPLSDPKSVADFVQDYFLINS
jgi:molybdopterin-guanine dinucleotide biosynthesis protein MobB